MTFGATAELVDHIYIYIYICKALIEGAIKTFMKNTSRANATQPGRTLKTCSLWWRRHPSESSPSSPRVPPASSDVDDGGASCNFGQGAVAWLSGPPSGGGPPQIEEALRWRSRFEVRSWVLDGRGRCSPGRRTAAKMSVPNHATI